MLEERVLIKLRYLRVKFNDPARAIKALTEQNLPINFYNGYYYICPQQRRLLNELSISFKT